MAVPTERWVLCKISGENHFLPLERSGCLRRTHRPNPCLTAIMLRNTQQNRIPMDPVLLHAQLLSKSLNIQNG